MSQNGFIPPMTTHSLAPLFRLRNILHPSRPSARELGDVTTDNVSSMIQSMTLAISCCYEWPNYRTECCIVNRHVLPRECRIAKETTIACSSMAFITLPKPPTLWWYHTKLYLPIYAATADQSPLPNCQCHVQSQHELPGPYICARIKGHRG